MAIAIGASPAFLVWRQNIVDNFGRTTTKTTLLDGTTSDTILLEMLADINALSNGGFVKVDVSGRVVTGMNASATDAIFNEVTDLAELTFSRTNPVNTAKTLIKSFLIPVIVGTVVNSDKSLDVGTPGTDSLSNRLARLISNLESKLAFIGSDGAVYTGSFTFQASKSGKVSTPGI